jgi:hypothetical protein
MGFPLRRLGEAYDMQGHTEEALRMVLESVHWLAFQQCARYVEEAKAEVLRLAAKWAAEKTCNHGSFGPKTTSTPV